MERNLLAQELISSGLEEVVEMIETPLEIREEEEEEGIFLMWSVTNVVKEDTLQEIAEEEEVVHVTEEEDTVEAEAEVEADPVLLEESDRKRAILDLVLDPRFLETRKEAGADLDQKARVEVLHEAPRRPKEATAAVRGRAEFCILPLFFFFNSCMHAVFDLLAGSECDCIVQIASSIIVASNMQPFWFAFA